MEFRTNLLRTGALLLALFIPLGLPADTILGDFQVNTEFPGHPPQDSPYSVANWQTQRIYTTFLSKHDGANWDVALARHNYDLQPVGQTTYLNVREGTYNCLRPKLVIRSTGVGAAWIEARSPNRIMFRSLDGNGNPTCPPVRVENDFSNVPRDSLSIAALYDGFLLVWYDGRDSSKIWAQKADLSGQLIGPNFPIQPDSTGSILGLEAQNHPDGRVLVSWVTNGQYSRGRWLDHLGNFVGGVFEMTRPYTGYYLLRSMVRLNNQGWGLLFQYRSTGMLMTFLDESGVQAGDTLNLGFWNYWTYIGPGFTYGYNYGWPDLISLPSDEYVRAWYAHEYGDNAGVMWSNSGNRIYSSLCDSSVVAWGIAEPGRYDLCQLDDNNFLYTFDCEYIGLRKYETASLNSPPPIVWIYEPEIGAPQNASDISVHQSGQFRIIYSNWIELEPYVYTRFFNANGAPSNNDLLISMDSSLCPVTVGWGRMAKADDDQVVIAWGNAGKSYGTEFVFNNWGGTVENFGCNPSANSGLPKIDINNSDYAMLVWLYRFFDWSYENYVYQGYFQSFSQLFAGYYPPELFNSSLDYPGEMDVALRDDGRFLICWRSSEGSQYQIMTAMGENYHEISGGNVAPLSSNLCSPATSAKSSDGYWITWIGNEWGSWPWNPNHVNLWRLDTDGNPADSLVAIDEEEAEPVASSIHKATTSIAVASASDNFAVCWQDARNDSGDIYCRQFNPDGSFFGNEYRVNSDPVGVMQKEPAVAIGLEDRLYFTWTDFRNPGGQGDIYCKVIEWEDALDAPIYQPPLPRAFDLFAPSPNPFNGVTAIRYQLPANSPVSLRVYDTAGRLIKTLVDGRLEAGSHQVLFAGSDLASGIYIARLQAGKFTGMQKLVLLK